MVGILIQLIVSGIAMGFIYALVGIEYTLIWNASGVLNFSHDKLITLGAYIFGGTYIGAPFEKHRHLSMMNKLQNYMPAGNNPPVSPYLIQWPHLMYIFQEAATTFQY